MKKQVDVPKDLPVLTPGKKQPSMFELSQISKEEAADKDWRAVGGPVNVAAFNSSI